MVVRTTDEAMGFFLENSSGSVKCIREDGTTKECSSYPEAVKFLTNRNRKE